MSGGRKSSTVITCDNQWEGHSSNLMTTQRFCTINKTYTPTDLFGMVRGLLCQIEMG